MLRPRAPSRRHGPQPRRGVALLPQLPPLLRADLPRGQGQGPRQAVRRGLQRLDARRVVRRLRRPSHPALHRSPVGSAAGGCRDPPQRGTRCSGRHVLGDTAVPRTPVHPRRRSALGALHPGLCRDRHGHLHAHRLVLEDAVHVRRCAGGGRVVAHVRQRHVVAGRLALLRLARGVPHVEARLQRGSDRLDPLHPRTLRQGLGAQPGLGRGRGPGARASFHLLLPTGVRLLLRRRARPGVARPGRGGQHHLRDRLPPLGLDVAPQPGDGREADGPSADRGRAQDRPGQRDQDAGPRPRWPAVRAGSTSAASGAGGRGAPRR